MEHYSVHLDQYISLTSSSSGNFLTPWNIFSAAVLLITHGVQPNKLQRAAHQDPTALVLSPCWFQHCWGGVLIAARAGEPKLGAKLHKQPPPWDCPALLAHTLSQHRGTSLYPSAVRNRTQSSSFGLFAI